MLGPSGMYPKGFHPVNIDRNRDFKGKATAYTRTLRPPRYYLIDFGLSRRYPTRDITDNPLRGGDKTAPEHRSRECPNPFHTDVYYIGNLVRVEFMRVRSQPEKPTCCSISFQSHFPQKYHGFQFMEELVGAMTNEDPAQRPSIEEVIKRFTAVQASLRGTKLRSALTSRKMPRIFNVFRQARQSLLTIQYTILQHAAIPNP